MMFPLLITDENILIGEGPSQPEMIDRSVVFLETPNQADIRLCTVYINLIGFSFLLP